MKSMGISALFILLSAIFSTQQLSGDWDGALKVGTAELRLVVHLGKNSYSSLKASPLDSVDQNVSVTAGDHTAQHDRSNSPSADGI